MAAAPAMKTVWNWSWMMRVFGKWALVAFFSLAGAVSPAAAHHSFAMFDQTKISHLDGVTVKQFNWTNPHTYVVVEGKDGSGTTSYTLECSSTNMMSQSGWKFNTIKVGDKVTVDFYPLRSGKPGGMLKTVTLSNGKTLKAW
ncbi:hypothetical protein F9288_17190 [Sphingomonas sp. CL5.1]|uniref:DUF6152 family protein n=1 Tax=Sphingomonas sp. CL5.1 TaxID=2653203 RepID=UPI0015819A86|nr:DUF6152 family protein [Sphingomonas sp. CL5.1]QKS01167.1 hypothetical protein F9288_17190 [Sphingomonas sp. CL5.1]